MVTKKRERGAAIVESTLVMTTTLLLIFGSISIAIDCYQRIAADSGAFFAAHVYTLNIAEPTSGAYETLAAQKSMSTLANNVAKNMMISSMQAQMQALSVTNRGFALSGDVAYFNQYARHGGVSLIAPQARQALVEQKAYGIFGTLGGLSVNGAGIEPDMQIINPSFDMASKSSYAVSGGESAKYYGTGMDLPPYYFSHNYLGYCTSLVWGVGCNKTWEFRGLGVAEYLTNTNWSGPSVSILDSPGTTPNVFAAMLCHQRVYAYTTTHQFLDNVRPLYGKKNNPKSTTDPVYEETPALKGSQNWKTFPFKLIYAWDAVIADGTSVDPNYQIGTETTNPLAGCENVSG
jgi:hypothetical protein